MNPSEREKWLARHLAIVLEALAGSAELASALVFKGAWILNRLLGDSTRQSFDLDSNMTLRVSCATSGGRRTPDLASRQDREGASTSL